MSFLTRLTRNRNMFVFDILSVLISYVFLVPMIYRLQAAVGVLLASWEFIALSAFVFVCFTGIMGCYRVYWVYGGTREYLKLMTACLASSVVMVLVSFLVKPQYIYPKVCILICAVSSVLIIGIRMSVRAVAKLIKISLCESQKQSPKKILIVGAGNLGVTLVKDIYSNEAMNYTVVGFIDDDKAKWNQRIYGVKVMGGREVLNACCDKFKPDEIVVAIADASAATKKEIINLCSETTVPVKLLPGLADSLYNKNSYEFIREVEVEDLLEREPVKLDNSRIAADIEGKVVMVTGGGGSIGSELCRQIARFSPGRLVILDIYENNLFDLGNELSEKFPNCTVDIVVASVCDRQRLEKVFDTYKPYIVFHAAAHKHVPMMEANAPEAVKNNVFGTFNVAKCADKYKVKRFVLISTDKAVNPTNVMGATKRVCEMIIQAMAAVSSTEFTAVRFGNVLNSNGSVLPTFKQQIKKGGPITVTDPEITRFFMTIPEAAQLVLQSAAFAKGGEIFVLDMGEPVKIYDLAKKLIRLSGLEEGKDIEIKFVGLRPGEKLYEELLMTEEGLRKTGHNQIYIGSPFFDSYDELQNVLAVLEEAVHTEENQAVRDALKKVVPGYTGPVESKQEAECK